MNKKKVIETICSVLMFCGFCAGSAVATISQQTQRDDEGNIITVGTGSGSGSGSSSGSGTSGNTSGSGNNSGASGSSSGNSSSGNNESGNSSSGTGESGTGSETSGSSGSTSSGSSGSSNGSSRKGVAVDDSSSSGTQSSVSLSDSQVSESTLSSEINGIKTSEENALNQVLSDSSIQAQQFMYDASTMKSYLESLSCEEESKKTMAKTLPVEEAGDPVLIPYGLYHLQEKDMELLWGTETFFLDRTHITSTGEGKSFGLYWCSSLDKRIIRGSSAATEKEYKLNARRIQVLNQHLSEIKDSDAKNKTSASKQTATYITRINTAQSSLKADYDASLKAAELNKYSACENYDWMKYVGIDYLLHIDEKGTSMLFKKSESDEKKYECINGKCRTWIQYTGDNSDEGFAVHYADGKIERYDNYGRIKSITDKNKNKLSLTYDQDVITAVGFKNREIIKFKWNNGHVIEAYNPVTGNVIYYNYNGDKLVSYKNTKEAFYSYVYDDEGDIKEIVKPDSTSIKIKYDVVDSVKKVSEITNEENGVQKFVYGNGSLVFTNEDNDAFVYTFDDKNNILTEDDDSGNKITRTYDENSRIVSYTDFAGTTQFTWNEMNLLASAEHNDVKQEWTYLADESLGTYKNGIQTEYFYDLNKNCTQINKNSKCVYKAKYNSWGGLSEISGNGLKSEYKYDENFLPVVKGNLNITYDSRLQVSSTETGGVIRKYNYISPREYAVTTDYLQAVYTEDSRGNIIKVLYHDDTSSETAVYEMKYNGMNLLTEVKKGEGKSKEEAENDLSVTESRKYSAAGKLTEIILYNKGAAAENDGYAVKYSYEWKKEKMVKLNICFINPDGSEKSKGLSFSYSWDYLNKKLVKTTFDSEGKSVSEYFDENGSLLKKEDSLGIIEQNSYDRNGRLVVHVNEYGGDSYYRWNDYYNKLNSVSYDNYTAESFGYNSDGLLSRYKNASGKDIDYSYSRNYDRLTVIEQSVNGSSTSVYNSDGVLINKSESLYEEGKVCYSEQLTKNGNELTWKNNDQYFSAKYDGRGNLSFDSRNECKYLWNFDGKLISEKNEAENFIKEYEYNVFGLVSKCTDSLGNAKNYFYNELGQLLKVTDSQGIIWQGTYDCRGNLLSEKGRLYPEKKYVYDIRGRLLKKTEAGRIVETRTYSDSGKTVVIKDAAGKSRTLTYDKYGNLIKCTDASGNISFELNKDLHKYTVTDRNNVKLTYEINGKVEKIFVGNESQYLSYRNGKIIEAASDAVKEKFSYSISGNLSEQNSNERKVIYEYSPAGKKSSVIFEDLKAEFFYLAGRVNVIKTKGNKSTFSKNGKTVTRTDSCGITETKLYDETGRLTACVRKDKNNLLISGEAVSYDSNGRINYKADIKGRVTVIEYDSRGRVTSYTCPSVNENNEQIVSLNDLNIPSLVKLQLEKSLQEASGKKLSLQNIQTVNREKYQWDDRNNLVRIDSLKESASFTYDESSRLVKKTGSCNVNYSYDKNGNLIEESGMNYKKKFKYSSFNRMTECIYSDFDSGLTVTRKYDYDLLGRLYSVSDEKGNAAAFMYEGTSARLIEIYPLSKKENKSADKKYRYAGVENYSAINNTSRSGLKGSSYGSWKSEEMDIPSKNIKFIYAGDVLSYVTEGYDTYAVYTDEQNNIEARVNVITGNAETFERDFEGRIYGLAGNSACCCYRDTVSGFVSVGLRWYSPEMVRFTTEDPARNGCNWYCYCNGDSINFTDRTGLYPEVAHITELMQQGKDELLGNSRTERISEEGCYVTLISGVINTLKEESLTGKDVNTAKDYFGVKDGEFDGTSYLRAWGITVKSVSKPENIESAINSACESNTECVMGVKIKITKKDGTSSPHFVGIWGNVINIDGEKYVSVIPTSANDTAEKRKSWVTFENDGNLYLPVDDIQSLRIYSRTDCSK